MLLFFFLGISENKAVKYDNMTLYMKTWQSMRKIILSYSRQYKERYSKVQNGFVTVTFLKPSFYCQGDMINLAKLVHFIVLSFFQPYCIAVSSIFCSSFFFAVRILFFTLYCYVCFINILLSYFHAILVYLFHQYFTVHSLSILSLFFSPLNVNDDTSTQEGHKSRLCLHMTGYMICSIGIDKTKNERNN